MFKNDPIFLCVHNLTPVEPQSWPKAVVQSCIFNSQIVLHISCLWLLLPVALILKCNITLNANDSILPFIIKAIIWTQHLILHLFLYFANWLFLSNVYFFIIPEQFYFPFPELILSFRLLSSCTLIASIYVSELDKLSFFPFRDLLLPNPSHCHKLPDFSWGGLFLFWFLKSPFCNRAENFCHTKYNCANIRNNS